MKHLATVTALCCGMVMAHAADAHLFSIESDNAATALRNFASQSGWQVLASGRGLEGRRFNAVMGELSPDQALDQLLAGSGMRYRHIDLNTVALVIDSPAPRRLAAIDPVAPVPAAVPERAAADDAGGFELDEVIVTARRRAENLQDAPLSVAAFSGDALEQRQVFSTQDLDAITPNLQFATIAPLSGNNSAAQVFIRGIGQTDPTAGVDPGVGIYIDDVYMGSALGGAMDFRDIADVQVLRGPQGALFGRNTIGGAILIRTKEPGSEFGGTVRAGIGSDNLREAFLAVDAPVSGRLGTRWTLGMRGRDGYVHRRIDNLDLGDVNNYSATGKLLWRPSDQFRLSINGDYTAAREHGTPLVFAAINETAAFPRAVSFNAGCPGMANVGQTVPMIDDPRCANDFWNDGPFVSNGTLPLRSDLTNWGAAAVAEWQPGGALSFKSVTSYRELDWAGNRDADNTPFPILHTVYDSSGNQFSQELQGLFGSRRLNGVVGLYYFLQKTDDHLTVTLSPPPTPAGTRDSNDNQWDNSNWAAFTQWTLAVTDGLGLTAGVRHTAETKRSLPFQFNYGAPSVLYVPHQWFSRDFSANTGSASLQYRWNENLMTYLSWSQGFKSGGFNSRFNGVVASGVPPPFDAETADSKELGVKFDLAASLRLNAAVFTTRYDNLQFTYRVGTAPFLFNAGKASINGAEVELNWVPSRAWTVDGGLGYLDAGIDSVSTIVGATTSVTTASKLPYTPRLQGNLSVAHSSHLANGIAIEPRLEATYTASQFFDAGNTVEIAQNSSITMVNAGITVSSSTHAWRATVGVNDIADRVYPIAGNSSLTTSSGYAEIAYNRGREVFMNFSKNF